MATRGVFGFIQNNDFKGFFKTGAFLPHFLKDIKDMAEEVPKDFDLSSITLIETGHGERGSKEYELGCLVDIDTDKYLLDKEDSSENWLNSVSISPKDLGINPLNTCGYKLPDASFRPLDALFIELVVIVNLDARTIDVYKGRIFNLYPELKYCSSGEDFINLAASFGQRDNIFVDMYAKHYIDFKNSSEKIRSMSSEEKRQQDFTSRETHEFLTSARMFDYGPVTKIASIKLSVLQTPPVEFNRIIKTYVCFKTLGRAIETYYNQKVNNEIESEYESKKLLISLDSVIKDDGFVKMYI